MQVSFCASINLVKGRQALVPFRGHGGLPVKHVAGAGASIAPCLQAGRRCRLIRLTALSAAAPSASSGMSGSAGFASGTGTATFRGNVMAAAVVVVPAQGGLINQGRSGSAAFSNGGGKATFCADVAEVSLERAAGGLAAVGLSGQGRSGAAEFTGGAGSATFNAAVAAVPADIVVSSVASSAVHAAGSAVVAPSADSDQGKSGSAVFANGTGCVTFSCTDVSAPAPQGWNARAAAMQAKLSSLGLAGVLAYGLLNTMYYTAAFFTLWVYVVKVPRALGIAGAVAKAAEVAALTWAGSQVTKLPRAAAAVVLAPFVDHLLNFLQGALGLKSKRGAFLVGVGTCVFFASAFYGSLVLIWS